MKSVKIIREQFDGSKFAARYSLDIFAMPRQFYVEGDTLYYPDSLPDEPVLEPPDEDVDNDTDPLEELMEALVKKRVLTKADVPVLAARLERRKRLRPTPRV